MLEFPPTIIVVHPKERRKKCTAEPLRGQTGFVFWKFPKVSADPLEDYVRLGFGGPLLSSDDAERGLLILDGTWRWTEVMQRSFNRLPVRSLPAWKTAFPRISRTFEDPQGGLATIEAIFAAYRILGRETGSLLADYVWADEFLERNRERL